MDQDCPPERETKSAKMAIRIFPLRELNVRVDPMIGPLARFIQNPTWIIVFDDMIDVGIGNYNWSAYKATSAGWDTHIESQNLGLRSTVSQLFLVKKSQSRAFIRRKSWNQRPHDENLADVVDPIGVQMNPCHALSFSLPCSEHQTRSGL
jgi:hypothetical protein